MTALKRALFGAVSKLEISVIWNNCDQLHPLVRGYRAWQFLQGCSSGRSCSLGVGLVCHQCRSFSLSYLCPNVCLGWSSWYCTTSCSMMCTCWQLMKKMLNKSQKYFNVSALYPNIMRKIRWGKLGKGYDGVKAYLGTFLSSHSDHHQRCNLFSASSPGRNNQKRSNFWLDFEEIIFDNPYNQEICNFGNKLSLF